MGQEESTLKDRQLKAVESGKLLSLCPYSLSASALEGLLIYLQKEKDPLFELNVPKGIRHARPEELLAHLWATYSKKIFEVTGEEAVQKHLQLFDEVEYIGTRAKSALSYHIRKGMDGTVEEVFGCHDFSEPCIRVAFYDEMQNPVKIDFPSSTISQLVLCKGIHRRRLNENRERLKTVKIGATVEYIGETPLSEYEHYVPPGARGIVRHIQQTPLRNALVLWRKMDFLMQTNEGVYCGWKELKIVRKNEVDIEKILELYGG